MDTALVTRAQQGDEAAFAELMEAVGGRLQRIAYSVMRDRGLAEDATQQALLQMWRKLPGLRDPSAFEAWSYRFVIHACHAEARKASRSLPQLATVGDPSAPDEVGLVDDRDQLERGFRRLSVDHRAVIVLHHYVGLPLPDVAATLGIPLGTAHSRLDRAMTRLRSAMHSDIGARDTSPVEVAP